MADRKELVAAREAALKELKRTDARFQKTLEAYEVADEKRDAADGVHNDASNEWDAAVDKWRDAVKELAEYDADNAEEFV